MPDIRFIRENPELVKENMKKRFRKDIDIVDSFLSKDKEYRELLQKAEKLKHERNTLSRSISEAKKKGKDAADLLNKAKEFPKEIELIEEDRKRLKSEIDELLKKIPNILHESVPIGKDDSENVEISREGRPRKFDFDIKSHVEICEDLDIADFDASARVSGNGFFYLKNGLALLNQALIRFGIDFMIKRGYTFIEPPLMIRKKILDGCIDMAFFEEIMYKIEGEDLYPIATSEHPLIGIYTDQVIDEKELPIRLCGYSQCFRKEVGSHGIDEKGLFRTHQFNKVEQVVICRPEDSYKIYDELLKNSVELVRELGLPSRVFESCSGDLGDLKAKGADTEVWSPRKGGYIEVGSVSNLTDAQARRSNIKVDNGKERYFPHTLNNTAIATSRMMVAILENYQNKDGSVDIPAVLQPYMNGKIKIKKVK